MSTPAFRPPSNIVRKIKNAAPLASASENYGRRGAYYGDAEDESYAYHNVLVYIQKGLGKENELFTQLAKMILQIQKGGGIFYSIVPIAFGKEMEDTVTGKPFKMGYTSDWMQDHKLAKEFVRISGIGPSENPSLLMNLIPKINNRNAIPGKSRVNKEDLLIIVGRKDEVFFHSSLQQKIASKIRKNMLAVEIGDDSVQWEFKNFQPMYINVESNINLNNNSMPQKFAEKGTEDLLKNKLININELYKENCIKRKGKVKGGNDYHSEIIAGELLKKISLFENIKKVTRNASYFRDNHCNIGIDFCKSNRDEENFAKRITGLEYENIGLILDYQVPLKDSRLNTGLGKIDLVSFNKDRNTLYLIELKYKGNQETLLKAILEGYTYYKTINTDKLVSDLNSGLAESSTKIELDFLPKDVNIQTAVLVDPDCNAYNEMDEMKKGLRPNVLQLSKKLNIHFFTVNFIIDEFVP